MSSLLNPVGPEPSGTYWRRRAALLAGALVALLLLWTIASAAFGSDGSPDPSGDDAAAGGASASQGTDGGGQPEESSPPSSPAAAPTGSVTPAPSGTPTDAGASSAPSVSASPSAAKSPSATPVTPCPDAALALRVAPKSATTQVGAGMAITATLTNLTTVACTRDVAATVVRVTSGRALVWSSQFCSGSQPKAEVVTIKPGKHWSGSFEWPGHVTSASCPDRQPQAAPGTYRAVGSNKGIASPAARFVVR